MGHAAICWHLFEEASANAAATKASVVNDRDEIFKTQRLPAAEVLKKPSAAIAGSSDGSDDGEAVASEGELPPWWDDGFA